MILRCWCDRCTFVGHRQPSFSKAKGSAALHFSGNFNFLPLRIGGNFSHLFYFAWGCFEKTHGVVLRKRLNSSSAFLYQRCNVDGLWRRDLRDLSRRELVIVPTLTEGARASWSTAKVYMTAILRKLGLQNRTQAAIWARTHLGALLENAAA